MKRALIAGLLAVTCWRCPAQLTEAQATNAIIGEAGSEPFEAQVAVASALRNRGSLRGVYGASNPVVATASQKTRKRALAAWLASAQHDVTHGLRFFGCKSDSRYFDSIGLHPVMTVGAITFWRE